MHSITRLETPLRRVLQDQGRRQNWLAEQVGCDPSDMSNYVRGLHVPEETRRVAIAAALGRHPDELWPPAAEQQAA